MKRILSVLTVALVMVAMVLVVAMPAFAEDYYPWCPYDPWANATGDAIIATCLFVGEDGFTGF